MRSHHSPWLSHLLLVLIIGLAAMHRADAHSAVQPINSVIGDRSFMERFGVLPDGSTDEDLRISTHLAYVERLLRSRDVDGLPTELRRARILNLDRLHEYLTHGIFPRNYDYSDRRPCFIDRDGRICAVGYLVEQSAGRAAAEQVNVSSKYERIKEMRNDALEQWLKTSGLTLEEAAMIQPTYGPIYNRVLFERSMYEPSDLDSLGVRGKVLKMETRDSTGYSQLWFDYNGFIDKSMTVRKDAKGDYDTIFTESEFHVDFAVRTNIYTWRPGWDYVMRETIGYYPVKLDSAGRRRYYAGREYSLFTKVQNNRDWMESVQNYSYDDFGRLATSGLLFRDAFDTLQWTISYDTLVPYRYPAMWMESTFSPVLEDGTVKLTHFNTDAHTRDIDSIRILERRARSRSHDVEISVVDGRGRRILHIPMTLGCRSGPHVVAYEYDEKGNVTHELTMALRDYKELSQGRGKLLDYVTYRYTFDDKGNWIRRERTSINYERLTPSSTVGVTDRTIQY